MASRCSFGVSGPATSAVHRNAVCRVDLRGTGSSAGDGPNARVAAVVVAMGAHALESSILTTALLRQGGVSHIIARSTNDLHARVLRAVGAHEVVDPEAQMGQRLAEKLTHPNVIDELELGDAIVAEVEVSTAMLNRSIAQLQIRNRYGATILAVRRGPVCAGAAVGATRTTSPPSTRKPGPSGNMRRRP